MKLTQEQFEALSAYEPYFNTAVNGNWARHPGQAALQVIHNIYESVSGIHARLNGSCQVCILNLLRDCGQIFFQDKQERIDQANDRVAVELTNEEIEVKKVAVKTRKPRKKTE